MHVWQVPFSVEPLAYLTIYLFFKTRSHTAQIDLELAV